MSEIKALLFIVTVCIVMALLAYGSGLVIAYFITLKTLKNTSEMSDYMVHMRGNALPYSSCDLCLRKGKDKDGKVCGKCEGSGFVVNDADMKTIAERFCL